MVEMKSEAVAASNGLSARSYGLTRMILIDSFSRRRIVEMALHGGSVITGRNGQGKTTLLKLVPLFHGESPSRIVQKAVGRESFMQHYLPNTTSYIVFEYVREPGEYCLAVHHADPEGVHLQHRFIHHAYAQELFVGADGRIIDAQSLGQHVRLKKISASSLIGTQVAYRNILHNTPQKGTKEREYAASYSFVPPHYRLAGVERIISGMFSRQTDFDDLQNIVVRSLQGGDSEVSLLADRNQAERWIQDKRAYEATIGATGYYDMAKVQYDANAIAVQSILHAGARFNAYEQFATDQLGQIAEKIAKCETQLAIIETKDREDLDEVRNNARTTGDHVKSTEALSEKYALQKADYERSDIELTAAESDRIPEYVAQIDQLTDRRTTLEGSADQIRAAINEQRERARSSRYALLSAIGSELDAAREVIRGKRDLADVEAEKQREAMRERQEHEREALTSEITELLAAERLIREQVGNPMPTPEIQRYIDETQTALEAARAEEVTARRAEGEAEAGYQNSVRKHEAAERAVRTADTRMEQAKRNLDLATRFVEGPEGSLLNMLRKDESPNTERIARLLTNDALLSGELSPRLIDEGLSLFGYDLDTDRLPVNPHVDLASARAQLRLVSEARDEAEAVRADALAHRGVTNKARIVSEQERDVARHRLGMAEKATFSATEDYQRIVKARTAYIEALRAQGASKVAAAVEVLDATKQRLTDLRAVHTEDREHLKQAQDAARREFKRQNEALQSGAWEREAALQRNTESHLSSLKEDLNRQLSEAGVNPDTIHEIQNQIDNLQKLRHRLSGRLREVEIWRQWRQHAPQEEAARQASLIQLRAMWAAQTAEADKLLRRINEKKQGFEVERSKLRASEHVLNQDLNTVLIRREKIGELRLGAFPGPASWRTHDDILRVIVELGKAETELAKTQRSLDAELSRLDDVFRAYPTSQVCEFRTRGRYDAAGRHRLDGYRDWYENTHQETQRLLISQANGIAGTIRGFYHQLKEFEGATKSFNAGLQRHLGDATTFDGVEGLEIRVVSNVAELDYWDRVETVTDLADRWLSSGTDGAMPDEAFSQALASLIEIWRQSGSIKTDLRTLIRIEGEVTEKGQRRRFNNARQLENVSSTGLSYLILVSIFVAFLNRMRQGAPTIMTWPLDELRDIDQENTAKLVSLLANNKIELVCAFPDPDPGVMVHFAHRFMMDAERRLVSVRLPSEGGSDVR